VGSIVKNPPTGIMGHINPADGLGLLGRHVPRSPRCATRRPASSNTKIMFFASLGPALVVVETVEPGNAHAACLVAAGRANRLWLSRYSGNIVVVKMVMADCYEFCRLGDWTIGYPAVGLIGVP